MMAIPPNHIMLWRNASSHFSLGKAAEFA